MQWHRPSGAIHLSDDFEAQGLSNLAWAAAKLRFHHPELMETLGWQGIGGRVELTFASKGFGHGSNGKDRDEYTQHVTGPKVMILPIIPSVALCKETVDAPRPPSSMRKRSPAWREHSQRLGLLGLLGLIFELVG